MQVTPKEFIDLVRSKCLDDGGCWIWLGCVQSCGVTPTMHIPGTRKTASVRRLVLQASGVDTDGKLATYGCESPLCVAPHHTIAVTRKELQERIGKEMPLASRMRRNAATAKRMRAASTLDEHKAAEIRASGKALRELASEYNVTLHTIWQIKRGKTWVSASTTSNPFAQLIALT